MFVLIDQAGGFDHSAYAKLVGHASVVAAYEADGAADEQGCGKMLAATHFPQCKLCIREKAHAARGAIKKPYQAIPEIDCVLKRLVFGKDSLARRIDSSDVLKGFYLKGQQVTGSKMLLKNLGFAKQRFDSHSQPLIKMVFTLDALFWALGEATTIGGARRMVAGLRR